MPVMQKLLQQTECIFRQEGHVVSLALTRAARKNALGRTLLQELRQSIDFCRSNGSGLVRAVVLSSGVEGTFCAGADLKERKEMTPEEARLFVDSLRAAFCEIEDLTVPIISAIEGHALGGGLELALSTDIRIAGSKALLGVPETSLAIIPGAGGTQRLTKTVGLSKAKELIFTAKPVTAAEAQRINLVNQTVDAGTALQVALEMARTISSNGPIAVAAAKCAVVQGFGLPRDAGMLIERQNYEKVLGTSDRLEGLKAFSEKRRPEYKGH